MTWEMYGIVTFEANPVGRTDLGLKCLLGIGMHGVFILDPTSNMIQAHFLFESIPSWSYNDSSFSIFVGTFVHH